MAAAAGVTFSSMRIVVLVMSVLLAAPSHAATIKFFNGLSREVEVVWTELAPNAGPPKRARLASEELFDTGIPVGGGQFFAIAFQRKGKNVAPPVVGTNFETAMLLQPKGHRAYIALRPVYDEKIWAEAGTAIGLMSEDRPSSLYCISGDVREWNGKRVIVFANGLVMELAGRVSTEAGRKCFCGRAIGPADGLDRFEAGSECGGR